MAAGTALLRRTVVLAGSVLALTVTLAPSALASPPVTAGEPVVMEFPECFGRTYLDARPTVDGGWVSGPSQGVIYAVGAITYGTEGDDVIVGTPEANTIFGKGGRDKICSGGGDDRVYGDEDDDEVDGGPGADLIKGGPGGDRLYGQENRDEIWGDDANGLDANDYIWGGGAVDTIYCTGGNLDFADGGQGVDLPATSHGCETYDNQ